ncbi:hypothetical protein ABE945_00320 [Enterococcus gilvus]|uniref:hypothetical protein n=1 Tax=Enterococcus gilvus TaxID=160453 RepID=UPI003D6B649F
MEDGQINSEVYLGKYIGQSLEKRMEIINSYMLAAEGGENRRLFFRRGMVKLIERMKKSKGAHSTDGIQ